MKFFLLLFSSILLLNTAFAINISGTVTDKQNNTLSFASILIKGTTEGTTANSKGFYSIDLQPGTYTLICQYIGYVTIEKKIIVGNKLLQLNFTLEAQPYNNTEVVVQTNREDPAYEIIRQAIKKRPEYADEIKRYQSEVYIKGQLQLRDYPKKFMGETVDFEDGDSSKRKMIFLSETVAKYSYEKPNAAKIEVLSTKVSGNSNGFGFSSPQIISFYDNNINVGDGLNPRGFISPISNNALYYYKYKFEGSFYENGKEISRIKVIPKRKYEPLFNGYISIIENEWRLHSVQLQLVKEQQLQLLDTLNINQINVPLQNKWVVKQQVIYAAGKLLGFNFFGNFVQVYNNINIEPLFKKKFFDNTLIKFFDSSNKKSLAYWDSVRPIPLLENEVKDYKKKDSLEKAQNDPKYLDSLDKKNNKINYSKLFILGQYFSKRKNKVSFGVSPLISALGVNYNTAEGKVSLLSFQYNKEFEDKKRLSVRVNMRYGKIRKNFNPSITTQYVFDNKFYDDIVVSLGSSVFQFNNNNPIKENNNSTSTYYWQKNYMKTYMANFLNVNYRKAFDDGFFINFGFSYQHRKPMDNMVTSLKGKLFTPNFPTEILENNITEHKAFATTMLINWRPGSKYIEFPNKRFSIGSKYPSITASVTKGWNGILGSTVNYCKWKLNIYDNLNFKIGGTFNYVVELGGFLQNTMVYAPDYQHFMGNQTTIASEYLRSFQLMPYYQFSNTKKLYTKGHIEYHLNGLLSNKIPFYKKLNWFFVLGTNVLYINQQNYYYEAFVAIENILKVIRVDFVQAYQSNQQKPNGIRVSIPIFK